MDSQPRQDPIFIVGFPRSGTTLLQSMLTAQEGIVSFPETHFFDILAALPWEDREELNQKRQQYLGSFLDFSQEEADSVNSLISQGDSPKTVFEFIVTLSIRKFSGKEVQEEVLQSFRWLEKTPDHVMHLDTILEMYPKASIVYILREPVQSINSYRLAAPHWGQPFKTVEAYAARLKRGYRTIKKIHKQHPASVSFVRYEDLLSSPARTLKQLCDRMGISFREDLMHHYSEQSAKIALPNESWKSMVNQPLLQKRNLRKVTWSIAFWECLWIYKLTRDIYNRHYQHTSILKYLFFLPFLSWGNISRTRAYRRKHQRKNR
jgi:hypothetical protein